MMNACIECPHLKYGSGCGLAFDPDDEGEFREIDNIYEYPPDWCPINNEIVDVGDADDYPDDE